MQRLQEEEEEDAKRHKEDEILDDIGTLLQNLGYKAVEIQGEVADQDKMITATTQQVAHTQDKLDVTNSRVDKLNEKLAECCGFGSLKNKICVLGMLLFIILILLFLIVET